MYIMYLNLRQYVYKNKSYNLIVILQDLCRSGSFLIENVFYNDLRYADNIDYSKYVC